MLSSLNSASQKVTANYEKFPKMLFDPGLRARLSISFSHFSPLPFLPSASASFTFLPPFLPVFFFTPTCLSHLRHFFIFYLRRLQRQAKGGWNRRVWNMKQSYVRTIQAAVEKLSRVKHLCTRKHTCTQIHSVLPPKNTLRRIPFCIADFLFLDNFETCIVSYKAYRTETHLYKYCPRKLLYPFETGQKGHDWHSFPGQMTLH